LYSWDITYLKSPILGEFYYLYMVMDVWSRKIVGWSIAKEENMELSSRLIEEICLAEGVLPGDLVLHADNGGPMKGATMTATLQRLGVMASFSRPRVSDDNPYSESLFRTLKYRPAYPAGPFEGLAKARQWVRSFVDWYNNEHLHSAIGYISPGVRHRGDDREILEHRRDVYQLARQRHPRRWSGACRAWRWTPDVELNPGRKPRQTNV